MIPRPVRRSRAALPRLPCSPKQAEDRLVNEFGYKSGRAIDKFASFASSDRQPRLLSDGWHGVPPEPESNGNRCDRLLHAIYLRAADAEGCSATAIA